MYIRQRFRSPGYHVRLGVLSALAIVFFQQNVLLVGVNPSGVCRVPLSRRRIAWRPVCGRLVALWQRVRDGSGDTLHPGRDPGVADHEPARPHQVAFVGWFFGRLRLRDQHRLAESDDRLGPGFRRRPFRLCVPARHRVDSEADSQLRAARGDFPGSGFQPDQRPGAGWPDAGTCGSCWRWPLSDSLCAGFGDDRTKRQSGRSRWPLVVLAAYLALYALFNIWWLPESIEVWIALVPIFALLAGWLLIPFAARPGVKVGPGRFCGELVPGKLIRQHFATDQPPIRLLVSIQQMVD